MDSSEGVRRSLRTTLLTDVTDPSDPRLRIRDPKLLKKMNAFLNDVEPKMDDYHPKPGENSDEGVSYSDTAPTTVSSSSNSSNDRETSVSAVFNPETEDKAEVLQEEARAYELEGTMAPDVELASNSNKLSGSTSESIVRLDADVSYKQHCASDADKDWTSSESQNAPFNEKSATTANNVKTDDREDGSQSQPRAPSPTVQAQSMSMGTTDVGGIALAQVTSPPLPIVNTIDERVLTMCQNEKLDIQQELKLPGPKTLDPVITDNKNERQTLDNSQNEQADIPQEFPFQDSRTQAESAQNPLSLQDPSAQAKSAHDFPLQDPRTQAKATQNPLSLQDPKPQAKSAPDFPLQDPRTQAKSTQSPLSLQDPRTQAKSAPDFPLQDPRTQAKSTQNPLSLQDPRAQAKSAPDFPLQDPRTQAKSTQSPLSLQDPRTQAKSAPDFPLQDDWDVPPMRNAAPQIKKQISPVAVKVTPSTPLKKPSSGWDDWDEAPSTTTIPAKSTPSGAFTSQVASVSDDWDTPATAITKPPTPSTSAPASKSADGWDDDWSSAPAPSSVAVGQKNSNNWDDWSAPQSSSTLPGNDGWGSSSTWGGENGGRGSNRGRGRGWECGDGGGFRGGGRGRGPRVPRADDWVCPNESCGFPSNFGNRTSCFKCNANKPMDIGEGNPPRTNFGREGSFNPTNHQSANISDRSSSWSIQSKSRNHSFVDEPWGNAPQLSSPVSSMEFQAASGRSRKHKKKDKKHSKSKKRRKHSSSTSSSSSSSSSDEYHSNKSKNRKKKHEKLLCSHSHILNHPQQQQQLEPISFHSMSRRNEPTQSFVGARILLSNIITMDQVDASTQTPRFPDMGDTVEVANPTAYETGLKLSCRFSSMGQGESGKLETMVLSGQGQAVATKSEETKRSIQAAPGSVIAPKTRDKINSTWPMFCVKINNELVGPSEVHVINKSSVASSPTEKIGIVENKTLPDTVEVQIPTTKSDNKTDNSNTETMKKIELNERGPFINQEKHQIVSEFRRKELEDGQSNDSMCTLATTNVDSRRGTKKTENLGSTDKQEQEIDMLNDASKSTINSPGNLAIAQSDSIIDVGTEEVVDIRKQGKTDEDDW